LQIPKHTDVWGSLFYAEFINFFPAKSILRRFFSLWKGKRIFYLGIKYRKNFFQTAVFATLRQF